jgi:XTP/dITP diphosphohydrolase
VSEISLLIATRNAHKAGEIRAILGDGFSLLTLTDFPAAPPVVEDAPTFAGNATKKAVELARWLAEKPSTFNLQLSTPKFVLADDSGLEVDALNGAPGVHSARFAARDSAKSGNTPDADNNAKLLRRLQDVPAEKRTARFRCVLALVAVGSREPGAGSASPACCAQEGEMPVELFEGACEGRIGFAPRGQNGFGYDPLFIPTGYDQTFAELGEATKNQLSHRAQALEKLRGWLRRAG